jgi:hypothetical protein
LHRNHRRVVSQMGEVAKFLPSRHPDVLELLDTTRGQRGNGPRPGSRYTAWGRGPG